MTPLAPSVPAKYRGLWRREVLRAPGCVDRTTRVLWLQSASGLFVDLRIPDDRDADDMLSLSQQAGFAGLLRVEQDVLTWDRWLDFQPPGAPDVGRMEGEHDVLREYGVLTQYYEEWRRIAEPADGQTLALEAQGEVDAAGRRVSRAGVLVVDGEHFAYALGRPRVSLPVLRGLEHPADPGTGKLLDCVVAFGRHIHDEWRIEAATVPALEGRTLAAACGTWAAGDAGWCRQLQPDGVRRQWRVVESTPGLRLPAAR